MQGRGPVNTSRSLSEERRAVVSSSDHGDRSPNGSADSGELRHKLSEVWGFVGAISAVIAAGLFIIWAYVPDYWFSSMGIYFYPSRYWPSLTPTHVMATIILAIGCYIGHNLMASPPPTSLKTILDECGNELLKDIISTYEDEQPVEPTSDIGTNQFTFNVSHPEVMT